MLLNQTFFQFFKWQYRAGAGAGAKIKGKVEPELSPKLNNFGNATLNFCTQIFGNVHENIKISANYLDMWKAGSTFLSILAQAPAFSCFHMVPVPYKFIEQPINFKANTGIRYLVFLEN